MFQQNKTEEEATEKEKTDNEFRTKRGARSERRNCNLP